jgi:hypothetical protein
MRPALGGLARQSDNTLNCYRLTPFNKIQISKLGGGIRGKAREPFFAGEVIRILKAQFSSKNPASSSLATISQKTLCEFG